MTLRRRLLALSLAALGCESIAPRTTSDASVDAGSTVDALDVLTSDVVDASPDVQATDAPDVQTADIVDAPVADAPDVVTADIVDAPDVTTADIVDASVADTPDVATPDVVDASVADTPDAAAPDVVDASVNPFPSTGADGPFPGSRVPNDAGIIELEPRVWNFTTITVPTGVTVHAQVGSGVLDLRATGDVFIQGTIDLSGGAGGSNPMLQSITGLGGVTGTPRPPRVVSSSATIEAALGGAGTVGGDGSCMGRVIARGGAYGGGSSGGDCVGVPGPTNSSGAGGGGFAGGGGGIFGDRYGGRGGEGASHLLDEGGLGALPGSAAEGGEARLIGGPLDRYAGRPGGRCPSGQASAGGGGSIGRTAAMDLAVRTTLRPGSGGGGGGLYWDSSNRPPGWGGGGGGGGGGALRLTSPTSIVLTRTGRLLASGGAGGMGPRSSGPGLDGGGGSGGAIYLAAPGLVIVGEIRAPGGPGGNSGWGCPGGDGGLGRIRLSVDPVRCEVTGTTNPPIPTGCAPSPDGGVPGQAYVGVWPN